jgi:hypothetical protein
LDFDGFGKARTVPLKARDIGSFMPGQLIDLE